MTSRSRILGSVVMLALALAPARARAQWQIDGAPICTHTATQAHPVITFDGSGGCIVAWEDYRATPTRIYVQRLNSAGVPQWTANGVAIDGGRPNAQDMPVITTDRVGGAYVGWREFGAFATAIYVRRISNTGTPMWSGSALACAALGDKLYPAIASDGREAIVIGSSGGAVLAWNDYRMGDYAQTDVYAQAVDGDGTVRWDPIGVPVSNANRQQYTPTVVSDGLGALNSAKSMIFGWSDSRTDGGDVYAQRLSAAGAPQWTVNGIAVSATDSIQDPPVAVPVGSGNVIFAWSDRRSGVFDVYAQRVGQSSPWSTPNGVPVCVASGRQTQVQLASDGKGGAFVAWADDRVTGLGRLYAQRLDLNGAPKWPLDGIQVSPTPMRQSLPQMTADATGGAILAWMDFSNGEPGDIYVQMLDSTGTRRLTPDGLRICHAANTQYCRGIVPDGSGGAIVMWEDTRAGNGDLYAQKITANGGTVGVVDRPTAAFRLSEPMPNPTRGATSFRIELPTERRVTARILGIDGRIVRTLHDGETFGAGSRVIEWDGADDMRRPSPAGVYFLSIDAGHDRAARKILNLR